MKRPRVLCVASPNWLGVSRLPRVLGTAGCHVTLLSHPDHLAARSRFTDARIRGSWEPGENLDVLRRHLAGGASYDWIMLADDLTMAEAVRRRGEDWFAGWFPVDHRSPQAELLIDKARFMQAAGAAGLPVPASRTATTPEEIRAAARELGFPVLVKPAAGTGGTGVVTAASAGELERVMPPAGTFVVQPFVTGRVGGTIVLYDRGRPLWFQSSLRNRVWPEPYGPSCRRSIVHIPGMAGIVEKLGAMMPLRALCEFEWILDGGTRPLIIELNPRPPGYLYIANFLGSGMPEAILAVARGGGTPIPVYEGPEGPDTGIFPEDAFRAASRRDWRGCARWLTGAAGPLVLEDPRIFLAHARRVLGALHRSLPE